VQGELLTLGIKVAASTAPLPKPITDHDQLAQPRIYHRDRLGGLLHHYEHAA
jgi:hypothetical protein